MVLEEDEERPLNVDMRPTLQEEASRRADASRRCPCGIQLLDLDAGPELNVIGEEQQILIDSGAFDHACPPETETIAGNE